MLDQRERFLTCMAPLTVLVPMIITISVIGRRGLDGLSMLTAAGRAHPTRHGPGRP